MLIRQTRAPFVHRAKPAPAHAAHAMHLERALSFIVPHRTIACTLITLTLIISALHAIEPLVMKYILDALSQQNAMTAFIHGIIMLAVLAAARELLAGINNLLSWRIRLRVQFTLLEHCVQKLHRLPLSMIRDEGTGALITRLDRGIHGFVGAITELTFNVLPSVLYLVLAVLFMLHLDWRLTLAMILFVPLPALIASRAAPAQIARERHLLDRWSKIYARFHEVLSGIVTVRSFAMEEQEKKRFLHDVSHTNDVVTRGVRFDSIVGAVQNTVVTSARLAAIGLGALLVIRGEITVGTLIAFLTYVSGLFGPVQGLTSIYRVVQTASVSIKAVFDIIDAEQQVADAPDATEAPSFQGAVTFENVSFRYPNSEKIALSNINLQAVPGETVALVGSSGAGKSSLVVLLQRLYDPGEGSICVDGLDLRTMTQSSLRRQIGIVLQEPVLFNDTIWNNIAYGKPDATQHEIEAAARAANAHTFIQQLPQGYDTVIGERGSMLSGGERQRIAIARAIIKNPPILILDEATSALDAESETLVQEALQRLTQHKTTFVIAHRLSTVVNADKIIVMHEGRIVQVGTHAQLVHQDGPYASLVRKQTMPLVMSEPRTIAA